MQLAKVLWFSGNHTGAKAPGVTPKLQVRGVCELPGWDPKADQL